MNTYRILSLLALAGLTAQVHATEYRFVADDAGTETRLCLAIAENDLDGLRREMRKLRQSPHHQVKDLVNSIRCNDELPAQFAHRYDAPATFSYLYRLTDSVHRDQVPHTSVEELTQEESSSEPTAVVMVHVRGR